MKSKRKRRTKLKDLHKLIKGEQREKMKEAGALDGRFKTKIVADKKKKYNRQKAKKIDID